jgi:xanthine dehydrogenase YagT iron-sulfur-binding subunit
MATTDDDPKTRHGLGRRNFLRAAAATGATLPIAREALAAEPGGAAAPPKAGQPETVTLRVNNQVQTLSLDPRTTLLDALREHIGLTGTKKGCGHGQCGACTVHLDGHRVLSCLTFAVMAEGHEITTTEGLASPGGDLHPMQQAFIDQDAFQCGYCTPGQVCSAVGVLDEVARGWPSSVTADLTADPELDAEEVAERMSGNLCRCGAYQGIVPAVQQAARR